MFAYQPFDEFAVRFGQLVVFGKLARIRPAQPRVVAVSAFGDIVEQGSQIQQVRLREIVHQRGGKRQFVAVFFHCQTTHVAQHGQDVVVHRVNVEQVVLQQADDFVPVRQVFRQQAVQIQKAHDVGQAFACFEKLQKQGTVAFVAVKRAVRFACRRPPCAQGFGGDAVHVGMLLPHLQQDKQVCRLLLKQQQIFGGNFVADLEIMRVQIVHDARIRQRHAFAQHGNQDAVQLHDRFGGAVEIAHQMLDAGLLVGAAQIAVFRQRALQIENQAVFFASRRQMQLDADLRQTAMAAAEQAGFHAGDDFVARQRIKIRVQPLRPCQPQHGMDVAQAACTVFHVRFQRKAGIFVVPLLHFQQLSVHERHCVAPQIQRIHSPLRQCAVAAKEARFQKRRVRRQIFVGRLQHLLQAACLHRRSLSAVP